MNDDTYGRYEVKWHTPPAPGSAYYQGQVEVWADDEEQADERARKQLKRNVFPEYSLGYIAIDEIKKT